MPGSRTQSVQPQDLVVTRVFDAPVELVWRAWSEPETVTEYGRTAGRMLEMPKVGLEQCLDKMAASFAMA